MKKSIIALVALVGLTTTATAQNNVLDQHRKLTITS